VSGWIENLPAEAKAIANAPVFFISAVVLVAVGTWRIVSWAFGSRLQHKEAELKSKRGEIDLLERQLADYRKKLDGATPDEAQARIEKLERQVNQLMPRKLSPEQKQTLQQHLRHLGSAHSITITNEVSSKDAKPYADELVRFFVSLGWTVATMHTMGRTHPPTGLGILLIGAIPAGMESDLIQAFQSAGLPFDSLPGAHHAPPTSAPQTDVALLISQPAV
jgi:hypothetical protein